MALARIISSSRECARELAVNLLDRGYAVEIVSPDAIPEDVADLELRVESDIPQLLTGSVEANNGVRSAALQFMHHLKTPTPVFARRPPGSGAPPAFSTGMASSRTSPVVASSERNVVEKIEGPLSQGRAPETLPSLTVPVAADVKQTIVENVEVLLTPGKVPEPVPCITAPPAADAKQEVAEKAEVPLTPENAPNAALSVTAPVIASAEQNGVENVVEDAETPLSSLGAPEAVPAQPETLVAPDEAARETAAPEPLPAAPNEALERSKFAVKIIFPKSKSADKRIRREGRLWRVALTFGGVLLAALGLGLAAMRLSGASAISSQKTPGVTVPANGKIQAAAPVTPTHASPPPEQTRAAAVVADLGKDGGTPSPVLERSSPTLKKSAALHVKAAAPLVNAAAPHVKAKTSKAVHPSSRRAADDAITPDTVTYFDEDARPIRVVQFPPHPAPSDKRTRRAAAAKTVAGASGKTAP